jgi:hypothetical protein
MPPNSSIVQAASILSDKVSAQSANRGDAAMAATSLTHTVMALAPKSRGIVERSSKC